MPPRILSSRLRIFCNFCAGKFAPLPSMAMEGRRRTGGGQKQSRHRGCVVGDKKKKERTRSAISSTKSKKKYVSVGSEEGTGAPPTAASSSVLRSNVRRVFSGFSPASDDLSEHDWQEGAREQERESQRRRAGIMSSALRKGYSPMRMFMATDEECLQVFNSSQQYAFLNNTYSHFI